MTFPSSCKLLQGLKNAVPHKKRSTEEKQASLPDQPRHIPTSCQAAIDRHREGIEHIRAIYGLDASYTQTPLTRESGHNLTRSPAIRRRTSRYPIRATSQTTAHRSMSSTEANSSSSPASQASPTAHTTRFTEHLDADPASYSIIMTTTSSSIKHVSPSPEPSPSISSCSTSNKQSVMSSVAVNSMPRNSRSRERRAERAQQADKETPPKSRACQVDIVSTSKSVPDGDTSLPNASPDRDPLSTSTRVASSLPPHTSLSKDTSEQLDAHTKTVARECNIPEFIAEVRVAPPIYDPYAAASYQWLSKKLATSRPSEPWQPSKRWQCCECRISRTIVEQQICSYLECQHLRCDLCNV